MADTRLQRVIRQRQRELRRSVGRELRRAREDLGLSQRAVSRGADLDPAYLPRIEAGDREPSLSALVAFAAALAHEVSIRLYPTTRPRIHDRIQAAMIEALLRILDPRWRTRLEVAVYRPVHGVIDALLEDTAAGSLVATESQGELRRVEQLIRWSGEKADALPSAAGWPWDGTGAAAQRLLLLRSTAATRETVNTYAATFRLAYPARTEDAYLALTTATAAWPGNAIVWVDVRGAATRVLHEPPHGVTVGR
jgi:transcriptional regulator with XRE-family HTH domain